jgi:hypothetical protein
MTTATTAKLTPAQAKFMRRLDNGTAVNAPGFISMHTSYVTRGTATIRALRRRGLIVGTNRRASNGDWGDYGYARPERTYVDSDGNRWFKGE